MPVDKALRDYFLSRRSVTLPLLSEPGPSPEELEVMFKIATRVPDHGKLTPWRLITISGDDRKKAGEKLAQLLLARHPDTDPALLEAERNRFLPAPLTVGVIARPRPHPKVPELEQMLSAGNVAFNLVHAANIHGYGTHWVTRWFSFDKEASAIFGAAEDEQFVGFVHIGTPQQRLEERDRPRLDDVVSAWQG